MQLSKVNKMEEIQHSIVFRSKLSLMVRISQLVLSTGAIINSVLSTISNHDLTLGISLFVSSMVFVYLLIVTGFTAKLHPLFVMITEPLLAMLLIAAFLLMMTQYVGVAVESKGSYGSNGEYNSYISTLTPKLCIAFLGFNLILFTVSTFIVGLFISYHYYKFDHDSHTMIRGGMFMSEPKPKSQNDSEILENPMFVDDKYQYHQDWRQDGTMKECYQISEVESCSMSTENPRNTHKRDYSLTNTDIVIIFNVPSLIDGYKERLKSTSE